MKLIRWQSSLDRRLVGDPSAPVVLPDGACSFRASSTPTSVRTCDTSISSSSRESLLDDYAELTGAGCGIGVGHRSASQNRTAILTQNLLSEIRQAVYEAQPKGMTERSRSEIGFLIQMYTQTHIWICRTIN